MSSICEQVTGRDNKRYLREFSGRTWSQRLPISGSLDLTRRCNLDCVHCYIKAEPGQPASHEELPTSQWRRIIDEIKEAGCLYLLLTGGEPLLRGDFPEIYAYAKKSGFLVTVFTNGTLIDGRMVDLFCELPPHLVEISIYGADAVTHDRITSVSGSFENAMRGIKALLAQGIRVQLKSMLLTLNCDNFKAIEDLAQGLGVKFRFDPAIFPTLAGDHGPVALRVSPERAVDLEMANPARERDWREFLDSFHELAQGDGIYNCGSGVNTFHVDSQGGLFPCLMVRSISYPLGTGSFREGWDRAFNDFRNEVPHDRMPCRNCQTKLLCGYCPGFFHMENKTEHIPSAYLCEIGRVRAAKLASSAHGG